MTNMNKVLFTGALVAGLVSGNVAMADNSAQADDNAAMKAGKDSCKGMKEKEKCKGMNKKDSCKAMKKKKKGDSCSGKNGCKGKKNEEMNQDEGSKTE